MPGQHVEGGKIQPSGEDAVGARCRPGEEKNGIREKGLMYVCMCAYVLSGDLFMSDKLER